MKMVNYQTSNNIIYLNHVSSSVETGYYQNSAKPDCLANIMKNSTVIFENKPNAIINNNVTTK